MTAGQFRKVQENTHAGSTEKKYVCSVICVMVVKVVMQERGRPEKMVPLRNENILDGGGGRLCKDKRD